MLSCRHKELEIRQLMGPSSRNLRVRGLALIREPGTKNVDFEFSPRSDG